MKKYLFTLSFVGLLVMACKEQPQDVGDPVEEIVVKTEKTVKQIMEELTEEGYQIFEYVDPGSNDTIIMQQYFMAFLKRGPVRTQDKAALDSLQVQHLNHLSKMYELGHADISGPFGDDGDIRGITIYNTPNMAMADSLANADPMAKAGRLVIEIHPWWAAKGYPLR